jgi:hypothetical protein
MSDRAVHMGCAWGPYGERVEHVESVWGPDRAERNHSCSAQPFARPPILATWGLRVGAGRETPLAKA